jgi:hypothetical protein
MWTTVQIVLGVLSLGLFFIGEKLSIPFLSDAGIACLGLTSIIIGWEAIITRRIVLGRRRHGIRETYTGVTAMLQGMEFNLLGLFLIAVAILLHNEVNAHELGVQMARHPGLPLIAFGMLCLIHSVITLIGPLDTRDHSRFVATIGFLAARLLPGIVLVLLGFALTGLGIFEIVAPNAFDQMGRSLLEALFGVR